MQRNDPEFTYRVQGDEESRIINLMWTNGNSKLQYKFFGDVITFDTTYWTNLYDMPFGLFVGVNNHFQSIILAGVLMRDEQIESFQWVFSKFVNMVGGKNSTNNIDRPSKSHGGSDQERAATDCSQMVQMACS